MHQDTSPLDIHALSTCGINLEGDLVFCLLYFAMTLHANYDVGSTSIVKLAFVYKQLIQCTENSATQDGTFPWRTRSNQTIIKVFEYFTEVTVTRKHV